MEPLGAARVAESFPHSNGIGDFSVGEIRWGGPSVQPLFPTRDDPFHLGLLAHELAHEDAPGGRVIAPPGQRAASVIKPGKYWLDEV